MVESLHSLISPHCPSLEQRLEIVGIFCRNKYVVGDISCIPILSRAESKPRLIIHMRNTAKTYFESLCFCRVKAITNQFATGWHEIAPRFSKTLLERVAEETSQRIATVLFCHRQKSHGIKNRNLQSSFANSYCADSSRIMPVSEDCNCLRRATFFRSNRKFSQTARETIWEHSQKQNERATIY
jgi:hypothetical protein